ncbi:MAG: DUF3048 domain-containing protein [Candidatus Yanofskybacteria bacterium]|nr:DUF3048 domain-containing protein [Candidatus Yanofskybacteria bacterium]
MKLRAAPLDMAVIAAIAAVLIIGIFFVAWIWREPSISVVNTPQGHEIGTLSGKPCSTPIRRPFAVMLASDPEARPLSGIGAADMVFEMPVTPNGITRMMAVYQCENPSEIGSIRSARSDFIPLAQGIDAILAHWGGEHDALASLQNNIIDHIDAMQYEGTTYYRKERIPRPHNGFTTIALLQERAETLGYRASTSMEPLLKKDASRDTADLQGTTASVSWPQHMDVRFSYDASRHAYARWRGGEPEIDALTKQQVYATVVIRVDTDASFLRDQYIRVRTLGTGTATIWQGGKKISALWKKQRATDPLRFTDAEGREVPLERGTIWILIDAPLPSPSS